MGTVFTHTAVRILRNISRHTLYATPFKECAHNDAWTVSKQFGVISDSGMFVTANLRPRGKRSRWAARVMFARPQTRRGVVGSGEALGADTGERLRAEGVLARDDGAYTRKAIGGVGEVAWMRRKGGLRQFVRGIGRGTIRRENIAATSASPIDCNGADQHLGPPCSTGLRDSRPMASTEWIGTFPANQATPPSATQTLSCP